MCSYCWLGGYAAAHPHNRAVARARRRAPSTRPVLRLARTENRWCSVRASGRPEGIQPNSKLIALDCVRVQCMFRHWNVRCVVQSYQRFRMRSANNCVSRREWFCARFACELDLCSVSCAMSRLSGPCVDVYRPVYVCLSRVLCMSFADL